MLGTKIGIAKVQKNARREVKPNLRCAYFRLYVRVFFCRKISSKGRQAGGIRAGPDCSLPTHFAHIAKASHHMQETEHTDWMANFEHALFNDKALSTNITGDYALFGLAICPGSDVKTTKAKKKPNCVKRS